ncbi:DUF2403 domain-containing lipoprotein [Polyangium jinanense]|uniref:DUF2403 domain-containing lipoprotein n=1 Tax=Polyangium jinanense TaxID=2829994 RepID=A0A9X3WZZ6_9BACT|nr:DUF2403 domain-containing lipoprotein [Polyangium jinanense]MDC3955203.1 DUF2403 domain-containing lipoprotein [Polyangium jinanense]MDC3981504.1 DUF2403 domain-containing lipoprotein [Polyangium jinanense]
MMKLSRLFVHAAFGILACACGSARDDDGGGQGGTGGNGGSGGTSTTSAGPGGGGGGLGTHPTEPSTPTRGGTMTFKNVGAPGWWPRRIDRDAGDPACTYKDGTDTWGGHCCMKEQHTTSTTLAPFDEEMTLIMKAIRLKQLAVYQPSESASSWSMISSWDAQSGQGSNLVVTEGQMTSADFTGDLTKKDCVNYFMQEAQFPCGDGKDYYCPNDPGINHLGWSGSKLIVFLGSMTFDDAGVTKCDGDGQGHAGPWVAFVASELIRDGGRKWNGLCNCYSKTGTVGDGCGEINVFEVVLDNNQYSNREFMSTGVRSYQAGHVGGNVCGEGCDRDAFADDVEVVDACAKKAYTSGPEIEVGGGADGCPVWRRPIGDRYFMILLDEKQREIQVAVIHPEKIPAEAAGMLPLLPGALSRDTIDALLSMRLPE